MNIPEPKPHQVLYNALPLRYKTWLKFYDSIAVAYREAAYYRCIEQVTFQQYELLFGQQSHADRMLVDFAIEYEISREFMLARIALELLPSRLKKQDISTLENALHSASKYDGSAIFYKGIELLNPIWEVGLDA